MMIYTWQSVFLCTKPKYLDEAINKSQFTNKFYHTPPWVSTLQAEQWKALIVCLNIDTKLPCEHVINAFPN
jgi:hypothetical protein